MNVLSVLYCIKGVGVVVTVTQIQRRFSMLPDIYVTEKVLGIVCPVHHTARCMINLRKACRHLFVLGSLHTRFRKLPSTIATAPKSPASAVPFSNPIVEITSEGSSKCQPASVLFELAPTVTEKT
jgi:hypothetical protein